MALWSVTACTANDPTPTPGTTRQRLVQTSDTYLFNNSLQSFEGGPAGNVLTQTYNGAGAFVGGSFGTAVVDASICPNAPTVPVYSFPQFGGLRDPNDAPVIATGDYTITTLMKFSPLRAGYSRIYDFSDSTIDTGIYALNND